MDLAAQVAGFDRSGRRSVRPQHRGEDLQAGQGGEQLHAAADDDEYAPSSSV
ncbi:hypothetical protein GCM10020218_002310 [Dactylosporangium vinaceum]